jgi:hypothetical protein
MAWLTVLCGADAAEPGAERLPIVIVENWLDELVRLALTSN